MKIDKSCKTCEFCFSKSNNNEYICSGANYGATIKNCDKQQECWSISLAYFEKLIALLSPEQKNIVNTPFPSEKEKIFKNIGINSEEEFVFYCIENKEE